MAKNILEKKSTNEMYLNLIYRKINKSMYVIDLNFW